eukprot:1196134-Prorocentrum_minimum.AAC.1
MPLMTPHDRPRSRLPPNLKANGAELDILVLLLRKRAAGALRGQQPPHLPVLPRRAGGVAAPGPGRADPPPLCHLQQLHPLPHAAPTDAPGARRGRNARQHAGHERHGQRRAGLAQPVQPRRAACHLRPRRLPRHDGRHRPGGGSGLWRFSPPNERGRAGARAGLSDQQVRRI